MSLDVTDTCSLLNNAIHAVAELNLNRRVQHNEKYNKKYTRSWLFTFKPSTCNISRWKIDVVGLGRVRQIPQTRETITQMHSLANGRYFSIDSEYLRRLSR